MFFAANLLIERKSLKQCYDDKDYFLYNVKIFLLLLNILLDFYLYFDDEQWISFANKNIWFAQ